MNTKIFQKKIWDYYRVHGRKFPWRNTKNPYRILVSEVMLQQTQVDRVVPKYKMFLKVFPTIESLAQANLKEVLLLWQGLGYNRRAKMLHDTARQVVKIYKGKLPQDEGELTALPGIGVYTAGAVRAFAYNQPSVIIETNIRSVFLHFFFKDKKSVSDKDIFIQIQKTLDKNNPRDWYFALMDYGSMLKKEENPNIRSKHYTKQSSFKGSNRQIRGLILKTLLESKNNLTKATLAKKLKEYDKGRVTLQIQALKREGLVTSSKEGVYIT